MCPCHIWVFSPASLSAGAGHLSWPLPAAALTKTLITQHSGPRQANTIQQMSSGVCLECGCENVYIEAAKGHSASECESISNAASETKL